MCWKQYWKFFQNSIDVAAEKYCLPYFQYCPILVSFPVAIRFRCSSETSLLSNLWVRNFSKQFRQYFWKNWNFSSKIWILEMKYFKLKNWNFLQKFEFWRWKIEIKIWPLKVLMKLHKGTPRSVQIYNSRVWRRCEPGGFGPNSKDEF